MSKAPLPFCIATFVLSVSSSVLADENDILRRLKAHTKVTMAEQFRSTYEELIVPRLVAAGVSTVDAQRASDQAVEQVSECIASLYDVYVDERLLTDENADGTNIDDAIPDMRSFASGMVRCNSDALRNSGALTRSLAAELQRR
ncbi:MAG: hypothetical protein AAFX44_10050 [Pseudomonadota bacterium]